MDIIKITKTSAGYWRNIIIQFYSHVANNIKSRVLNRIKRRFGHMKLNSKEYVSIELHDKSLKFLAPRQVQWQKLSYEENISEKEKEKIENAKKVLNDILLASLQMQNLVVVAGSGTSLGPVVRGPSMSDLWDAIAKLEDQDGKEMTREYIIKKISYHSTSELNIEDFLSYCDAYLQINNDKEVARFVLLCKTKILDKCSFCLTENSLIGHTTFLHRLSRRRVRDSRLKLFTTNYDICFETAAALQGIIVIDGFSFNQPRFYDPRFFCYDIVRRPRTSDDLGNYLEGVIQLYKLHGSVNWAYSSNNRTIIIKEKPTSDEVCIIYPAQGKYQQSYMQPYLELIAQFFLSLREPNTCLIVTGFGFNDNHLSEPILSAVKTNPHLRLIIADPCAEKKCTEVTNSYWKALFELAQIGEDIWLINATFQEFAELIPDLKSLTPAEKLAKDIRSLTEVQ